jgi:hypothetical protein
MVHPRDPTVGATLSFCCERIPLFTAGKMSPAGGATRIGAGLRYAHPLFSGAPMGPFVVTVELLPGSWAWVPGVRRITPPRATAGVDVGLLVRPARGRA